MSYHEAYRPNCWDEVLGNAPQVDALANVIAKRDEQTFLLSGPSGVGKTTLARIACNQLKCEGANRIDIDGATYTGINDMRDIHQLLRYQPFGKSKVRVIIVDECHRLSGQAWDALLKATEEPPKDVYWFFCTTQLGKVPVTIRTRSVHIALQPIATEDIRQLVLDVAKSEGIKLPADVIPMIVKHADGSARQALVNLALCQLCKDRKSAASILQSINESDPVYQLCQFVAGGKGSWAKAMAIMAKLEKENAESVRIQVMHYLAKALQNTKDDRGACHFLRVLELFSHPYNPSEDKAPLYLSIGQALFGGD
jgi:DNA polymerase III gamma/tau subunit